MRKFWGMIICICASIFLGQALGDGMNQTEGEIHYLQKSVSYSGFDEVIDSADVIISGEVKEIVETSLYEEYTVKILGVQKGDVGNEIKIRNYLSDYCFSYNGTEYSGSTNTNYEIGEDYLFILQHIKNVYEEQYIILSDVYIPINYVENSTILSFDLREFTDVVKPLEYITEYPFKEKTNNSLSLEYIESDNIVDIINESKYIVRIEVLDLYRVTDVAEVYLCEVIEEYKGDIKNTEVNNIIVPFFKNTVETGKQYTVCLVADTEDTLIYSLSSKNSVLDMKDSELRKILNLH